MKIYFYVICVILSVNLIYGVQSANNAITSARIESCPGCSLNRLPEVKQFIYDDVPEYENVEFKKIHGAKPELVLLNTADEEIDRIPLSSLSRQECNDLLVSKGFKKKSDDIEKTEF